MNNRIETTDFLVEETRRWLRREPATTAVPSGVAPLLLDDLARKNRLQPLLSVRLTPVEGLTTEWENLLRGFERAYQASLMNGYRLLAAGAHLAGALDRAGVRCLGIRGPFWGSGLYGDVGLRPCADVDILVPRDDRRRALEAANSAGYAMPCRSLPLRFFERHHLHWRLEHPGDGVVCELHWALDHPYKHQSVNYGSVFDRSGMQSATPYAWREPAPEHQLLIACIHASKHCRVNRLFAGSPAFLHRAVENGWLPYWLDVVTVIREYGHCLEWSEVVREADDWSVGESLAAGITGAAQILEEVVPREALQLLDGIPLRENAACARSAAAGNAGQVNAAAGFRMQCIRDAWNYVFPAESHRDCDSRFRPWRRVVHAVRATVRMTGAALETAVYLVAAFVRQRVERWQRNLPVSKSAGVVRKCDFT